MAPVHEATHPPGVIMWIIELNIAGFRYTRELPERRRRPLRFSPRHLHWPVHRHAHGHSHAA
ncbi:hypothetical protein [Mycobacterium gastri]|uniref:Uncharacterized protein n=1 Tax=Mycobacterium gastri TaxID=1777 RepID=A0A1X1V514_MYCGS|nr:hypothetical protein [Mycobacterium gastri]ETW21581.1 hypothetical protein MGAST_25020 [Mycobacterium gastri 'Wayne']ORV64089.1 hypothetical protein AWC07_14925 [Mycobacterium gastri]